MLSRLLAYFTPLFTLSYSIITIHRFEVNWGAQKGARQPIKEVFSDLVVVLVCCAECCSSVIVGQDEVNFGKREREKCNNWFGKQKVGFGSDHQLSSQHQCLEMWKKFYNSEIITLLCCNEKWCWALGYQRG